MNNNNTEMERERRGTISTKFWQTKFSLFLASDCSDERERDAFSDDVAFALLLICDIDVYIGSSERRRMRKLLCSWRMREKRAREMEKGKESQSKVGYKLALLCIM